MPVPIIAGSLNLKYPAQDPVLRSLAKADACAKPDTLGKSRGVRVHVTQGDKSLRVRKKKRNHDKRDVHFY